jgi:Starch binding domain
LPMPRNTLWERLRCYAEGGKVIVTFRIKKKVNFGYRVGILGESLGKWAPDKALMLDWGDGDVWASKPVEVER